MKFAIQLAAAAAFALCVAAPAAQAQGQLINYDLTGQGDTYTGAAVFGNASSVWNEVPRLSSPSNLALVDDTGAATGVTVSYTRANSGGTSSTGTFANIGFSSVKNSTPVSLAGLVPGGAYDLALFSPVNTTFTVDGVVKTTAGTTDWSSLVAGVNYVLYQTAADGSGNLSFDASSGNAGRNFSAFEITSVTPEPGSAALLFGMAAVGLGLARRRRK